MGRGLSAREAAQTAVGGRPRPRPSMAASSRILRFRLRAALDDLDEPAAQGVFDDLFGGFSLDAALTEVLIPYLARSGRPLAGRRRLGRDRALRLEPGSRAAALARARLGAGRRVTCDARGPSRRAPRHRPHHVRPLAAPARMADLLPGRGHADRRPRGGRPIAASSPRRARRERTVAAAFAGGRASARSPLVTPVALAGLGCEHHGRGGDGRDVPRGRSGAGRRDRCLPSLRQIRRGPRAPRVRGRSGGGGARRAGRRRPARGRAARSSR